MNPRREEEFYTKKFGDIKVEFEMWVASSVGASDALPKGGESILLQTLATLGRHGKAASEFLKVNQGIRSWYKLPGTRIQLIRHIAALLLFEYVLVPFVFGLSSEVSHALSWVDADIMSNG